MPLTVKLSAEDAVDANDAVVALLAQLEVPNKEPVNDVAITLPVIVTLPLISKIPFKAFSFPIPTLDWETNNACLPY